MIFAAIACTANGDVTALRVTADYQDLPDIDGLRIHATHADDEIFEPTDYPSEGETLPPNEGIILIAVAPSLGGSEVGIVLEAYFNGILVARAVETITVRERTVTELVLVLERNSVTCVDAHGDSDGDGVCDPSDVCEGWPDADDSDADTVPDGCDQCAGYDDRFDPDSDGFPTGCDTCPGDPGNHQTRWYPDCDGDGVSSPVAVQACNATEARGKFSCRDGSPRGEWSQLHGADCDDDDETVSIGTAWYPDCDGDGHHSTHPTLACGNAEPQGNSPCANQDRPTGGWSTVQGDDPDDADPEVAANPCAPRSQDNDGDGTCTPTTTLGHAGQLATGVHDFELTTQTLPLYVDGEYDGGGWVLVGRGREQWAWTEDGRGDKATFSDGLGTAAAFPPAYLASSIINEILDNSALDLTQVDIRIKRAATTDGSAYQETLWRSTGNIVWTWLFDSNAYSVQMTVFSAEAFGDESGGTWPNLSTRDASAANNHRRIFTWAWGGHANLRGFSYGQSVNSGTNDSTNFLWQHSNQGHAIPYTEVYIRPAP